MAKDYTLVNGKKVSHQFYLYGVYEPQQIPQEIIDERILFMRHLLDSLQDTSYMERDQVRIKKIIDGISFWQNINNY